MINMNNSNQCRHLENQFNTWIYRHLHFPAKNKAWWIRPAALPTALVTNLASVATRAALIGENIIKGLGNIFGSMIVNERRLSTGLRQLCFQVPKHTLLLPFTTIYSVCAFISHTFLMLLDPVEFTGLNWINRDKTGFDQSNFQELKKLQASNPNNKKVHRKLGRAYLSGNGVEQNTKKAIESYERAAQLDDLESMVILGDHYWDKRDLARAHPWYTSATEKGSEEAAYRTGKIFEKNQNYSEALDYFFKAAEKNHLSAKVCYYAVRYRVENMRIDFDRDLHTTASAAQQLAEATASGNGFAVAISAFLAYQDCVKENKQSWGPVLTEDTKTNIRAFLTPRMLSGFNKTNENSSNNIKDFLSILLPSDIANTQEAQLSISSILDFLALEFLKL